MLLQHEVAYNFNKCQDHLKNLLQFFAFYFLLPLFLLLILFLFRWLINIVASVDVVGDGDGDGRKSSAFSWLKKLFFQCVNFMRFIYLFINFENAQLTCEILCSIYFLLLIFYPNSILCFICLIFYGFIKVNLKLQ